MALKIIRAKVQTVWLKRKVKVTQQRGPDKGKVVVRERRFKVTLGTCIEFDDGWTIVGPDGRTHTGGGTIVRFNYRHRTWSVQRPQRCETIRVGYVFTPQGDSCWLKAERESGFTPREFERDFSSAFVSLCRMGHALAEGNAAAPDQPATKKPQPGVGQFFSTVLLSESTRGIQRDTRQCIPLMTAPPN
ncbi:hypothetical protein HS125_02890 [bacterium]|nr:hypothetical protein [bacterium]